VSGLARNDYEDGYQGRGYEQECGQYRHLKTPERDFHNLAPLTLGRESGPNAADFTHSYMEKISNFPHD
jgi:hypothetical protein